MRKSISILAARKPQKTKYNKPVTNTEHPVVVIDCETTEDDINSEKDLLKFLLKEFASFKVKPIRIEVISLSGVNGNPEFNVVCKNLFDAIKVGCWSFSSEPDDCENLLPDLNRWLKQA